jgi:hypothetical protein
MVNEYMCILINMVNVMLLVKIKYKLYAWYFTATCLHHLFQATIHPHPDWAIS